MQGFDNRAEIENQELVGAADFTGNADFSNFTSTTKGSAIQESDFEDALNQSFDFSSLFDSEQPLKSVENVSESFESFENIDLGQKFDRFETLSERFEVFEDAETGNKLTRFERVNQILETVEELDADDTDSLQSEDDAVDVDVDIIEDAIADDDVDVDDDIEAGEDDIADDDVEAGEDDIVDDDDIEAGEDDIADDDVEAGEDDIVNDVEAGEDDIADDDVEAGEDIHNHAKPENAGEFAVHIDDLATVDVKELDLSGLEAKDDITGLFGENGDFLDPGAGDDVVISGGGNDVVLGQEGGIKTITTGTGNDLVVLGNETTNRIFDFDPATDTLGFAEDVNLNNIVIAQGKSADKGGIDQPLDSENNALVIDKESGHILAALTFVDAADLSEKNFVQVKSSAIDGLVESTDFSYTAEASPDGQQIDGTLGQDQLTGGKGDDFLFLGDDSFSFDTATGTGPGEFPFPNTSAGVSEIDLELKDGVLKLDGTYKDFEGVPLFSDGVEAVADDAVIPNGADPEALIEGFLQVPEDVEGNPISGLHLHFSRENFADATVERYFTVTPTDDTSGTVSGEFELTPEEQAALLGKNLYGNFHSTKHPVGENRLEFKTVQFAEPTQSSEEDAYSYSYA